MMAACLLLQTGLECVPFPGANECVGKEEGDVCTFHGTEGTCQTDLAVGFCQSTNPSKDEKADFEGFPSSRNAF